MRKTMCVMIEVMTVDDEVPWEHWLILGEVTILGKIGEWVKEY